MSLLLRRQSRGSVCLGLCGRATSGGKSGVVPLRELSLHGGFWKALVQAGRRVLAQERGKGQRWEICVSPGIALPSVVFTLLG